MFANLYNLPNRRCLQGALAIAAIILALAVVAYAQGTTRYVYDDNGRLRAVVAPSGEANIYEYDAAGNITAIRRNAANTLEVLDFSPREGVPGTQVTIIGTGFVDGMNSVAFNGINAPIVSAIAPVIVVTVPNGVTTGPITVTTPQGPITTSQPFMVKGIQLAPLTASVSPGQTQQFTAAVFPAGSNQNITWSVNEINGGNATAGTISASGLYTAPAAFLSTSPTVRATSVADPSLFSEAQVMVGIVDTTGNRAAIASSVLVARHPPPPSSTTTFTALSAGVLIQRAAPPVSPITVTAIGAGVTTKTGPYISAITPSQVARGATVTVTITGTNLNGVTTLRFSNGSGGVDTNITASNLNVNGGGTSLTATLTVNASAALGRRLVVVSTASASSLTFDNGLNGIEIIP